jgi:hypothetical protein
VARSGATSKAKSDGRRIDKRRLGELRPITIRRGYLKNAEGSALIEMGGTRVLCAASVMTSGLVWGCCGSNPRRCSRGYHPWWWRSLSSRCGFIERY